MAIGGSKDEKILNINSKSVVRVLQETLNNAGYKVNVDGMYGDKTFEAVKKFQKNNNLISDGLIGKETLLILIKYIK
jgi:peptidoglycan hydrolase-like protein with peptidoglycan-binding domain